MGIYAVPANPLPTEPPEGWRFLVKGERIQKGDQTYNVLTEMWSNAPAWLYENDDVFGTYLRVPPIRKIDDKDRPPA